MNKGVARLFEVALTMTLIFIAINNIQLYTPPRYEDTENMYRLHRYAEDVALSLCNNEPFRNDYIRDWLPVNLTRRADAWDKNEFHPVQTGNVIRATFRQPTKMNESAERIRFCANTSAASVGAEFSLCERSVGPNCTAGTFSSDVLLPASGTTGWLCTGWTGYTIERGKTYILNMNTTDFGAYNYYWDGLGGSTNGFYYKLNVDDTQVAEVNGYTDYTTDGVVELKIEVYHDTGLNHSLPKDLDYHIWLYGNNTADYRLDDLKNETGNITSGPMATSSCLISGYWDIYKPRKVVVGVWNK